MYANLKVEMTLSNVSIEDIAKELGIHRNSVSNKINGGHFSIEEAFTIRERFFPKLEAQYLFRKISKDSLEHPAG